jgi:hypothetical protein
MCLADVRLRAMLADLPTSSTAVGLQTLVPCGSNVVGRESKCREARSNGEEDLRDLAETYVSRSVSNDAVRTRDGVREGIRDVVAGIAGENIP